MITGLLATIGGYLAADALGLSLAKAGLFGFGRKVGIARSVLSVGKALHDRVWGQGDDDAAAELLEWVEKHDPNNTTGFADGLEWDE